MSNKSEQKKNAKLEEQKKVKEVTKPEEAQPLDRLQAAAGIDDEPEMKDEFQADINKPVEKTQAPLAENNVDNVDEGFENAGDANDFISIDMGTFQFFKFSENKVPKIGAAFTGMFKGIRDGEAEGNLGIDGLDFEDLDGNKYVISNYHQLRKYFEGLKKEEYSKYIYRITLINVNKGGGQGGGDVLIFNVSRKLITTASNTSFKK